MAQGSSGVLDVNGPCQNLEFVQEADEQGAGRAGHAKPRERGAQGEEVAGPMHATASGM